MKNIGTSIFIIAILMCAVSFASNAQSRAHKTSSAKAYYGDNSRKPKIKKSKKNVKHARKRSKGMQADKRNRKRFSI